MAKPVQLELTAKDQSSIKKLFTGSKQIAGVKNARKIASILKLPRYQVMYALETSKLVKYAPGSYN